MRKFVELLEFQVATQVYVPIWVDSAKVVALSAIDEKHTAVVMEGLTFYSEGLPAVVAHKLGISLGKLKAV